MQHQDHNSPMASLSEKRPAWAAIDLPAAAAVAPGHLGHVHLIGIGGIGMSGIAEVLGTLGYRITGSDLAESEATRRLAKQNAKIFFSHEEGNVDPSTDVVVVSSAVDDANPEVREARKLRIPVIPRAEMLAELMRVKCGLAVAGAHGKTTTTSMVGAVLGAGGLDPTVVIGGRLKSLGGTSARLGRSRYMVVEADESDGTFLLLKPAVAVVTNIDREHLNYYRTMERLIDSYVAFINGIPFYGRAVLCVDCPEVAGLTPRIKKRYTTYGTGADADFRAVEISYDGLSSSYEVVNRGVALGRITIALPGRHMVLNSLAAVAAGLEFGMSFADCAIALAGFDGIMRRFEVKGEKGGVLVVDDYGHHPTEILATLVAARKGFPQRRIVAVFQPHRPSRVADLYNEFAAAFGDADEVLVTDIYKAGESDIEGITAEGLVEAMNRLHKGGVSHVGSGAGLADRVTARLGPGDMVLTLGAGDITRIGQEILARLGD